MISADSTPARRGVSLKINNKILKRHFIFHDADFINEQRNSASFLRHVGEKFWAKFQKNE